MRRLARYSVPRTGIRYHLCIICNPSISDGALSLFNLRCDGGSASALRSINDLIISYQPPLIQHAIAPYYHQLHHGFVIFVRLCDRVIISLCFLLSCSSNCIIYICRGACNMDTWNLKKYLVHGTHTKMCKITARVYALVLGL